MSLTLARVRHLALAAAGVLVLAVLTFVVVHARSGDGQAMALVLETPAPTRSPEPLLVVDVSGAVARPGVYRLPAGSRVADALVAAGGMTGDADLAALNKAAPIRDGQRIYVPRPGETAPATGGADPPLKIDINHATASELETLPGIGPTTAARIVRSRSGHPFGKIEELQTRGLVTARVFGDIRDLITTR